jgi:hypothetical protein
MKKGADGSSCIVGIILLIEGSKFARLFTMRFYKVIMIADT